MTLEVEIQEDNPVVTQMQQTTTVDTSSQQLEKSPTSQTPHASSPQDHVVSPGVTHHVADISLESLLTSPSPGATTLITSQPTPSIPPTIIPLFEAIDKTLAATSSTQSPITECIPQHVTGPEKSQPASTQTEEGTPFELLVTQGGLSSKAATTAVETIVSQ